MLRSLNARNLVTVGFDSRICLGTTVIDAMYRNYRVIVLRDCTATTEYVETQADGSGPYIDVFNLECKGVISLLVLNRIGFHRHHLIDRKGGEDGGAYAAARDLPDRLRPVVDIADGLTVHGL